MAQFLNSPITFDRAVRIALFVLAVLAITVAVAAIWEVLLPFLLAGIFAYILMPVVRFVQHKLGVRSRPWSVLIVFVVVAGLITVGMLFLVPLVEEELAKTIEALKTHSGGAGLLSKIVPEHWERLLARQFDIDRIVRELSLENLLSSGETLWNHAGGIINSTLSVFSWGVVFVMGIIYFIFIMLDFEELAHGFVRLFPQGQQSLAYDILKETDYYMNAYFRGQALIALSVGGLLTIGFSIIGLPLAIVLGIFIGMLNFIPYMQALGIIPLGGAAILMALQNDENIAVSLAMAYGVLMIVQVIQDSILVPKIMGKNLGMRPSLILLALSVWGFLLGFFGLLIALPGTMAIYSIYMRYIVRDEAYIKLMDAKMGKGIASTTTIAPSADSSEP